MAEDEGTGRCVTGIEGLDNILGGGIPVSSIVLVCGPTGTGKTALAVEFLARGAAKGEAALMICDAENEQQLLAGLPSFGFLPEDAVKKGAFSVIGPGEMFKDMGQEGVGAEAFAGAASSLDKVLSAAKVRRLAIDDADGLVPEASVRTFLNALRPVLEKNGCTAMIVSGRNAGGQLAAAADGVIALGDLERNGDFLRTMQVLKMRGTGHSRARYVIDLTPCGLLTTPLLKGGS
jgi:circadian clock protein KaiC